MRPDLGTILGIVVAFGGIVAGLVLEGGSVHEILQPTAALIVFGGTFGATMIALPLRDVIGAVRDTLMLWRTNEPDTVEQIDQLTRLAIQARQKGILSIETAAEEVEDPFERKLLRMGIDGVEIREIRAIAELRIEQSVQQAEASARALDAAGGYAPTVGILGAVLGLIQVMKHLDNIEEVGAGIAVAFVATIYGVAIANLVLLPAAKKIRVRAEHEETRQLMVMDGVIQLIEGRNPRLMRERMLAYVAGPGGASAPAGGASQSPSAEGA